jgi:hypothetical protein
MAAITTHEAFDQPTNPQGALWRYMDFPTLVSLLTTSELFLTSLTALNDPWEGWYSAPFRQEIECGYAAADASLREMGLPAGSSANTLPEQLRRSIYVNCWCMQDHESEALWRIYGRDSGVAIRTRYSVLAQALPDSVFLGQVRYIDPAVTSFSWGNMLRLAMSKRHFFKHELECRIVKYENQNMAALSNTVSVNSISAGKRIFVELGSMIEEIVISPLVPPWYGDCVRAVVKQFAPAITVSDSAMMR